MIEMTFEAWLVAANPHSNHKSPFVMNTMNKIKAASLGAKLPRAPKMPLFNRVRHLSIPALVALIVLSVTLVGGAVYASIEFAPNLIKILSKTTSPAGRTQYVTPSFTECSKNNAPGATYKFEINSQAPKLSDDDVQKILQAKCELQWIQGFANKTWPTYGDNATWKTGDHIYYARPDLLGSLKTIDASSVSITYNFGAGDVPQNYVVQPGQKVTAFVDGQEVPLSQIKRGDTVFTIVRVQETYIDYSKLSPGQAPPKPDQPKPLSVLAVVKLGLPAEYYGKMQQYLTEVPKCYGNEANYCANTPSIDVYPRGNEGAPTVGTKGKEADALETRIISGVITKLGNNTATLRSTSGTLFTVTLIENGFSTYNHTYAPTYNAEGVDATLKVGSSISIVYRQPKGADTTKISGDQVQMIQLQLEGLDLKQDQGSIKQY